MRKVNYKRLTYWKQGRIFNYSTTVSTYPLSFRKWKHLKLWSSQVSRSTPEPDGVSMCPMDRSIRGCLYFLLGTKNAAWLSRKEESKLLKICGWKHVFFRVKNKNLADFFFFRWLNDWLNGSLDEWIFFSKWLCYLHDWCPCYPANFTPGETF